MVFEFYGVLGLECDFKRFCVIVIKLEIWRVIKVEWKENRFE